MAPEADLAALRASNRLPPLLRSSPATADRQACRLGSYKGHDRYHPAHATHMHVVGSVSCKEGGTGSFCNVVMVAYASHLPISVWVVIGSLGVNH
jgi:hypothetical protein